MQQRTVTLRTFLLMVGVFLIAFLLVVSNSRSAPVSADVATPRTRVENSTPVALSDTPNLPTQDLLAQIYADALPSVVNIQVRITVRNPFGPDQPQGGEGTGWVWDEEGHIVTNNHVVEGADEILVNFWNGMWADARLVAQDPQADLAVIQVNPPAGVELKPLERATTPLKVGHYTVALGSPFGLDGSMTLGIVSALGRSFALGEAGARYSLPEVIQTDAAINPGNSGGPLLNLNGKVVGINFAIRSQVRSNSGVGFAIPIAVVNRVVPALIENGSYSYPFLGISGATIDKQVAEQENLKPNVLGVYVAQTVRDGPAARAGLRRGDIIVSIDGSEVRSFEDLIAYLITATEPGQSVELEVLRGSDVLTYNVDLSTRPGEGRTARPNRRLTVGDAIDAAKKAVTDENIMAEVDSATARNEMRSGVPVWVVVLEGQGQRATVVVDAQSGEVLSLDVEDMN